ncbi:MAG: arylsulfotransferase family protein, partial [Solirubrobacteraceae bacterium]
MATLLGREGPSAAATLSPLQSFDSTDVSDGVQRFQTLPGMLAPEVVIDTPASSPLAGLVITECHDGPVQPGPLIIGPEGQIVWFQPISQATGTSALTSTFGVQSYRGQPVLPWFTGSVVYGHGLGHYEIFDTSYRQIASVTAQRGLQGDLHEFVLTPQGTALFTCYGMALAEVPVSGTVRSIAYWFGVVQEVDVATGELLFHWRSDHHVALSESYVPLAVRKEPAWDYFHINAISIDPSDGNLVISGRNTCACYKLDRKTGKVIWRLGGKHSDFQMDHGTRLAFQHDVKLHDNRVMTVFDNGGGPPRVDRQSKGLVLVVDERRMRVRLKRTFDHDPAVYS